MDKLPPDISPHATIDSNGAVLLGRSIACDAHALRPIRVISHTHSDHTGGFAESAAFCEMLLMTPETRDMLGVLKPVRPLWSPRTRTLAYGVPFKYGDDAITLLQAGHIAGSAQVLVEAKDGLRIVYTGDFKMPRAEVPPADILVMEATYGDPSNVRPFDRFVEDELINLVDASVAEAPVYILGYHGKLQEVLGLLGKVGVGAPLLLQDRIFMMAQALERHGCKFGCYSRATRDKLASGAPFVGLFHITAARWLPRNGTRIVLSGWEFKEPVRQTGEGEYAVAMSDHSDFNGLMEYVERSRPRFVITDNFRGGSARTLAAEITRRLGIPAQAMP